MYEPFASFYNVPAGAGPASRLSSSLPPIGNSDGHSFELELDLERSHSRGRSRSRSYNRSRAHVSSQGHGELGAESQQITLRSMFHSITASQSIMLEQFYAAQQGSSCPLRGAALKSLSQSIGLSQAKIKVWYQWRQQQQENKQVDEQEKRQRRLVAKKEPRAMLQALDCYGQPAVAPELFESCASPLAALVHGRQNHSLRFQSIVKEIQHTLNEALLIQADWFPSDNASLPEKDHTKNFYSSD